MDLLLIIEILSVVLNFLYLFLLIRENIWCWPSGIIASALGVYLFFESKLYSEAILYAFYIIIGFYGWYVWKNKGKPEDIKITEWKGVRHIIAIVLGIGLSCLLGLGFYKNTDASYPFVDAHTTVFGLFASYLEANKVLSGWLYWIVLNATTVWLYATKDLNIYSAQMVVYFLFSVVGYIEWRRRYLKGT